MLEGAAGLSVLFRVSESLCALPLHHVVETMRMLAVEPFPGAPRIVRGLAMVRGVPSPVIEAARLLGSGEGPGQRWIAMRVGGRQVILAVDDVLGVRPLPPEDRMPLPPLLQEAAPDAVAALARLDDELLLVLQASRGLPEDVWAGLELPGVPVP